MPELPDGLLPGVRARRLRRARGAAASGLHAARERDAYVEANAAALRALLPADLVFANHVLLGGAGRARRAARATSSRRTARSSSTRCAAAPSSRAGAPSRSPAPRRCTSAPSTSARVLEDVVGHVDRVHEVPPGVDVDEFVPQEREAALAALIDEARRDPADGDERHPDRGNAERFAEFFASERADGRLLREADREQGRAGPLRRARAASTRARVIVGFGDYRAELEAHAPGGDALHRRARAPASRAPAAARRRRGRAVDLPGGVRDGRRRGRRRRRAAGRRRPLRASPRSRRASPPSIRRSCARLVAFPSGDAAALARAAARAARAAGSGAEPRPRGAPGGRAQLELDARGRAAARAASIGIGFRPWATSRRSATRSCWPPRRPAFEEVPDFTVAVEEEFALLDPATLGLVDRFEDVQQAARRHRSRAASRRRADRLRGRGAHGPLRDVRRVQPSASANGARSCARSSIRSAIGLSSIGTHPWSPLAGAADHRHAALPPKRRAAALRRLAQQHVRPARARRHQRRRPRDPRVQRAPQLPARAARRVGELAVRRGRVHVPALRARRRSSRACSRAAAFPTGSTGWDDWERYVRFLYETGSVTEHTQIWWSVRPHLMFPTVEIRICDAQPDLAEARSLAALIYSLDRAHRARARRGRAAAVVAAPAARGEPLARDPLGPLGRADRLRARRVDPGARADRAARRVGAAGRRRARRLAVARDPRAERRGAADRAPRGGRVDGGDLRRAGAGR